MNISNLDTFFSKISQRLPSVEKVDGDIGSHKPTSSGNILPVEKQDKEVTSVGIPKKEESTPQVNAEELIDIVAKANDTSLARSSNLKFSVAEGTNINVVRVEDSKTGELIRQIPSEQMVSLARALDDQIQGIVLEEIV